MPIAVETGSAGNLKSMAWSWREFGPDGEQLPATDVTFPTQADAESWLGENWRKMAADGVHSVTLLEDSREVYGPMSLNPPE